MKYFFGLHNIRSKSFVSGFFLFIFLIMVSLNTSAVPSVNGLFYGDGDENQYVLYNTSVGGSKLWYTIHDNRLYVALVVDRSVNENVFSPKADKDYTSSAGWTSHRDAKRLTDSEFAEFTLTVGDVTYLWQQGYADQTNGYNNTSPTWFSSHTAGAGSGTPPPGYVSSSSFVWNLNNYANNPSPDWNMTIFGTDRENWKSPFDAASPDTVPGLDGYPESGSIGFSSYYQWEWPMVYEWSVDLSSFGPDPVYVISANSHHSPPKTGDVNDYFPDPPGNGFLSDYGDLPGPYPTLLEDNGAYHYIVPNAVYLGEELDPEPDGNPDDNASGDDLLATDDEDGVTFISAVNGVSLTIQVEISGAGYLSSFADFNASGTLSPLVLLSSTGPASLAAGTIEDLFIPEAGTYTLTVKCSGIAATAIALRFRVTNSAGEGGAIPYGVATSGEVEDYLWNIRSALSTQIDIEASAGYDGTVTLKLYTVNENGNNDIEIYAMIDGQWVMVAMVPSEQVVGDGSNIYTVEALGLTAGESYFFRIVDESGHSFETGKAIAVARYRLQATRTSLSPQYFTATFNTRPYVMYVLNVSESLTGDASQWSSEYVQVVHPAFPHGVSGFCLEFQGAPEGTTTLRVPRNRNKAFFKLVEVDQSTEMP